MISTPARKVIAPISSGILRPPWLSGAVFNPISIIGTSDDGAFYLHKDYSTLWQESTKTTQVSDVEQYIGYRADLSGKGNHSSVVTSTERPLLSARINQFGATEDLLDSSWSVTQVSKTTNQIIESTSTSNHFLFQNNSLDNGNVLIQFESKAYLGSRYIGARPNGIGANKAFAYFDVASGLLFSSGGTEYVSANIADSNDGYYLCKMYANHASPPIGYLFPLSTDGTELQSYTGDGVSGVYFRKPDFRPANLGHLPYQWVNTGADYDISDYFPRYTNFDGVDDNLTTNWTNADTSTWTLARSIPGVGAQISTGQTFGSTTPFVDDTNSYAVFLIDRALTAQETADLTYYLNKLAGF